MSMYGVQGDHTDVRTVEWSRPSEEVVTQISEPRPIPLHLRAVSVIRAGAFSSLTLFSFPMVSRSWTFSLSLSTQYGRP